MVQCTILILAEAKMRTGIITEFINDKFQANKVLYRFISLEYFLEWSFATHISFHKFNNKIGSTNNQRKAATQAAYPNSHMICTLGNIYLNFLVSYDCTLVSILFCSASWHPYPSIKTKDLAIFPWEAACTLPVQCYFWLYFNMFTQAEFSQCGPVSVDEVPTTVRTYVVLA